MSRTFETEILQTFDNVLELCSHISSLSERLIGAMPQPTPPNNPVGPSPENLHGLDGTIGRMSTRAYMCRERIEASHALLQQLEQIFGVGDQDMNRNVSATSHRAFGGVASGQDNNSGM